MSFAYAHNPTRVIDVMQKPDATRVDLAFELEPADWPWMSLDPRHPVAIEKLQYLGGVTALMACGGLPEGRGSALTELTWSVGDAPVVGHATHGVARLLGSFADLAEGAGRFELTLDDAEGTRLVHIDGAGVVFDASDSKARRAASKAKARAASSGAAPAFVPPDRVGLGEAGVSFLGPLEAGVAAACVSTERGFHPAHPFHTGSGDHVNAGHLVDVAFQLAHLVAGRRLVWTSGTARYRRFVELDVPFVVRLERRESEAHEERVAMSIHQLERPCAEIEGTFLTD